MSTNRIEARFEQCKRENRSAFIPYITAGDPDLASTSAVLSALDRTSCDIVELGVPFSDPIGDGPVIQGAAQRALANGVTPAAVLELVRGLRDGSELPILLFTYYNPLLAYGLDRFAADAKAAGADGVLCVDLPPEEADEYKAALDAQGLCTVFLTAPTTTDARLAKLAEQCSGFVYYVSRLGVTGERAALAADLGDQLARIRKHTNKPIAVGFGIASADHAAQVAGLADGVVVGSALVRTIADTGAGPDLGPGIEAYIRPFVQAMHQRSAAST